MLESKNHKPKTIPDSRAKGNRAEEVAAFFLRLNGFFSIPNFAVHNHFSSPYFKTDADLLGVRFPLSKEIIDGRMLSDFGLFLELAKNRQGQPCPLFVIVGVKASGECRENPTWTEANNAPIRTVLLRMGALEPADIQSVGKALDTEDTVVLRDRAFARVCIAERETGPSEKKVNAHQITFTQIAEFFHERFIRSPVKVPIENQDTLINTWGAFGGSMAWRYCNGQKPNIQGCVQMVRDYIQKDIMPYDNGSLDLNSGS